MYFGSDNQTGASEKVLNVLLEANNGVTAAYADDQWTANAVEKIQQLFECDADVHFVTTGTAANSLSLACMSEPWDSILCHGQAHIINDELTAPEFFTGGARLVGLDTQQPKLSKASVQSFLEQGSAHPPHNAEPAVLSLTQLNESGQVYTVAEVTELATLAHAHGLSVHMDGARFANALAALSCTPAELTWKAGVDVLCLGATKNGALAAEAVVFFNKPLGEKFVQHRKRAGHLLSKSRWLGAQFCGWLDDDHWLDMAIHANHMAQQLYQHIEACKHTKAVWPNHANELFVVLPKTLIGHLRNQGAVFYEWPRSFLPESLTIGQEEDVIRLVTSFRTTEGEVEDFAQGLKTFT